MPRDGVDRRRRLFRSKLLDGMVAQDSMRSRTSLGFRWKAVQRSTTQNIGCLFHFDAEVAKLCKMRNATVTQGFGLRCMKDPSLRSLGYEHNAMMAGPFVSEHLVPDGVGSYPLFSNFCEHFVSIDPQTFGCP
jgi:hypothetical protein